MTAIAFHHHSPSGGGLIRLVRDLLSRLAAAHRRGVERRALAELDPYILADIGLDPAGVRADADHPARAQARDVPGPYPV
mgnify:CR=1 FL=1|jgi:uncharacterized protein YjiS (DUF1127 family)